MVLTVMGRCDEQAEVLLAICYLLCCALVLPLQFDWTVFSCGLVAVWAVLIAAHSGLLATFTLLGTVVALFSFDTEFSFLVGMVGFLVLEVLARSGAVGWLAASGALMLVWFSLGEPNQSWQMSTTVSPLIGAIGVVGASLIGCARRSSAEAVMRMDAERRAVHLETRVAVARQLHLGVLDSLNRVISLSHGTPPLVEQEARRASLRLRELLNSLTTEVEGTEAYDLVDEIVRGVEVLRQSGFEVHQSGFEVHQRIEKGKHQVKQSIVLIVRELFTNALKYADGDVRIELAIKDGHGIFFCANGCSTAVGETLHDSSRSSHFGLENIRSMATVAGARLHTYEQPGSMTNVLEFPIESQSHERPR